jgi:pimeloyl-ACP methyl ester carboxylesterase
MRCELEGIIVHYEEYGEGRPLLGLHGWPNDHRIIADLMEPHFERRAGWRRIYPDLPGMGRTPGPEWLTTEDQMLDVVLAFIDTVIPAQRFVVAGLSYGGLLARGVVHRRAAQMDGLALFVPDMTHGSAEPQLPPKTTLVTDPAFLAEMEAAEAQGAGDLAVVQGRKVAEAIKGIMPAVRGADHAFLARLEQANAFSFDVDVLAEPFTGPTLILTGRQDHLCGYRDAWGIVENYLRATYAVLDRAGHFLFWEQDELCAALTREWLDRVVEHISARR